MAQETNQICDRIHTDMSDHKFSCMRNDEYYNIKDDVSKLMGSEFQYLSFPKNQTHFELDFSK